MIMALVFASAAAALVDNTTYSAECTSARVCTLVKGHSKGATAWGRFEDAIEQTGTASLWVSTAHDAPAGTAAFAAGFLEGALSATRIFQQYSNFVAKYGVAEPSANLTSWLDANSKWLKAQVAAAPPGDLYWAAIGWQLTQLDGLVEGYNSEGRASPLTHRQLEVLNLQGDLGDLLKATDPSLRPHPENMTDDELMRYTLETTHCSALIKLLPDNSELFIGHNMWWGYYTMLAVIKRFDFPQVGAPLMMTSYPGLLASSDDYYALVGAGLVAMETTNPNYNASSFDYVLPTSVLYWQRVMAANYLARNGSHWMELMARHNSGTYNNMWMVLDYNLFQPGSPLVANTLWVGEQAPGYWHAEDQTHVLTYGYCATPLSPLSILGNAHSSVLLLLLTQRHPMITTHHPLPMCCCCCVRRAVVQQGALPRNSRTHRPERNGQGARERVLLQPDGACRDLPTRPGPRERRIRHAAHPALQPVPDRRAGQRQRVQSARVPWRLDGAAERRRCSQRQIHLSLALGQGPVRLCRRSHA